MWRTSIVGRSKDLFCTGNSKFCPLSNKVVSVGTTIKSRRKHDLLYQSPVPTDHFQSRLPRLPIPKLEDTCSRYLRSLKVAATDEQYQTAERLVNNFQNGIGQTLQEKLIARDGNNQDTHYVAKYWNDMYLMARIPLLHNFNICVLVQDDPRQEYQQPVLRATNFVLALCRFMQALDQRTVEPYGVPVRPSKANKNLIRYLPQECTEDTTQLKTVAPICMSQFKNIFRSTRVPRDVRDELVVDPDARHIVVMRSGQYFQIDVINENGDIRPGEDILADMHTVYNDKSDKPSMPVAVLTAGDRDKWKSARDKLLLAGNEEVLKVIDGAILIIALDEDSEDHGDAGTRSFLQGNGYNRWYDKPFSIVVKESGASAVFMEHAWGDGMALLYPLKEAWAETVTNPAVHPHTLPAEREDTNSVRRLEFRIPDDVSSDIGETVEWFDRACSSLNVQSFSFDHFGGNFIKSQKMSPDSFIQLGFQLAFYRLYGYCPSTYESCSTAMFRHGRTETMRPATEATRRVCEMLKPNASVNAEELKRALKECSHLHGKLATEAAIGQGFDRHLFALRCLATELGIEMPAMFKDESYAMMCNYVLSTSTLGEIPAIDLGAFAPVASDGYGLCYSVKKDAINGIITSYETRDCKGYLDSLYLSLEQMAKILQQ